MLVIIVILIAVVTTENYCVTQFVCVLFAEGMFIGDVGTYF